MNALLEDSRINTVAISSDELPGDDGARPPVIELDHVSKSYTTGSLSVTALDEVGLSIGTGVPVHRLRNMTSRRCHARLMIEVRRLLREHPELVQQGCGEVPGQPRFLDGI